MNTSVTAYVVPSDVARQLLEEYPEIRSVLISVRVEGRSFSACSAQLGRLIIQVGQCELDISEDPPQPKESHNE